MRQEKFYVYLYVDPRTNQPFYVGKGQGKRFLIHFSDDGNVLKTQRILEIQESGHNIEIKIFGMMSERKALELESTYIRQYKRICDGGTLTNIATGLAIPGSCYKPIRKHKSAKRHSEQAKQKIGKSNSDPMIYKFTHETGVEFIGTRYDFVEEYGQDNRYLVVRRIVGALRNNSRFYGWKIEKAA